MLSESNIKGKKIPRKINEVKIAKDRKVIPDPIDAELQRIGNEERIFHASSPSTSGKTYVKPS